MGIPSFLINATVTGVLAQRLLRKLCSHCRTETPITPEHAAIIAEYNLPIQHTFTSTGCSTCNSLGFKGRTGIFELVVLTPELRTLITKNPHSDTIYKQAAADGWKPFMQDAAQKVNNGLISLHDLLTLGV